MGAGRARRLRGGADRSDPEPATRGRVGLGWGEEAAVAGVFGGARGDHGREVAGRDRRPFLRRRNCSARGGGVVSLSAGVGLVDGAVDGIEQSGGE